MARKLMEGGWRSMFCALGGLAFLVLGSVLGSSAYVLMGLVLLLWSHVFDLHAEVRHMQNRIDTMNGGAPDGDTS